MSTGYIYFFPFQALLAPAAMSTKDGSTKVKRNQKRLFHAVIQGNLKSLQEVLEDGNVDVNAYDINSRTPLMHSVVLESADVRAPITRCLLDAGADVNVKDADGKTALMYAVSDRENKDVLELLLASARSDPNVQDLEGNTALMHAVNSDNVQAIRALVDVNTINNAVDTTLTNKHGYSALLMAVKLRRVECCKVLVHEAKADPNEVSKHWQGTLARLLEGGRNDNGKKDCSLRKGRRASLATLPPSLSQPIRSNSPTGSSSRPPTYSGHSSLSSSQNQFSPKVTGTRVRPSGRERNSSGLRRHQSMNRKKGLANSRNVSPEEDGTESLRDLLRSFEIQYQPTTSREDSQSSLLSESTLTLDFQGRPKTMREGSDSSIDTLTTLQSRPNTRQNSDLSIHTLEEFAKGRSPKFPRDSSALPRRSGTQPPGADVRSGRRTSWSRPSSSLVLQPILPWMSSRDTDAWLHNLSHGKADQVPRTFSSMSSYRHGVPPHIKLQQPKAVTGRSAKETALKHIRGSLRMPQTPTPSAHRVFSREDKTGRHLPALMGSKQ